MSFIVAMHTMKLICMSSFLWGRSEVGCEVIEVIYVRIMIVFLVLTR